MAGARAGWRGQKSVRTSAFLCHDCGLAASSNPACLSAHRQQPHAAREDAASRRPHAPGVCGRSPSSSHSAACTSSDGGAAGSSAGACMAPAAPSAGVPRRGAVDQKDGARNRASRSHTSTPAASLCRGARPPLSLCPALPPPCPTCVSPIYYTCSYKGPSTGPRIHGLHFTPFKNGENPDYRISLFVVWVSSAHHTLRSHHTLFVPHQWRERGVARKEREKQSRL